MTACFLSLQTFFGDSIEHYNNSDVLCDLLGLKYVSANVGPDSAIHTCGKWIQNPTKLEFPCQLQS